MPTEMCLCDTNPVQVGVVATTFFGGRAHNSLCFCLPLTINRCWLCWFMLVVDGRFLYFAIHHLNSHAFNDKSFGLGATTLCWCEKARLLMTINEIVSTAQHVASENVDNAIHFLFASRTRRFLFFFFFNSK